jgi:hypothetical protein
MELPPFLLALLALGLVFVTRPIAALLDVALPAGIAGGMESVQ